MTLANNHYNEQQLALANAPVTNKKVIGVAGAGTGKTTTILARTKRILAEYPTGNILLITFTRAAANDLKKRLELELTGPRPFDDPDPNALPFDGPMEGQPPSAFDYRRVTVGTFHSVIGNLIRRHATEVGLEPNFSIIDENSTNIMFRNLAEAEEKNLNELAKWALEPNDKKLVKKHFNLLASTVSVLVNISLPEELETGEFSEGTLYRLTKTHRTITEENAENVASFCYRMFKESMKDGQRTNTVTYDQVLFIGYLMAKNNMLGEDRDMFIHTIVDEYQDTNMLQDAFIRYIANDHLTIVGDIDQSIYGFRGGRPELVTQHAKEAEIYNLSYNYRSCQPILDIANRVIRNNATGHEIRKDLSAMGKDGVPCEITFTVSEQDKLESAQIVEFIKKFHEEKGVPYSEMAILIRSRMTLPSISQALTRANIPVYDTTKYADFMKSEVMTDTLNYLKVFTNPKDIYAFLGIIDRPKQGIGPVAFAKLQEYAAKHNQGLVEYLLSKEIKELTPSLRKKIEKFVSTYESVVEGNDSKCTEITLSGLVGYLHTSFGYEEWLKGLKNKDRYQRDLITLYGVIRDFEEEYMKENKNATLYDIANAFVFDMSSVSTREEKKDGVCITTIHNAKGLEWGHVFLLGLEQENFPGTQVQDEEDMESERRLLYVALTRAKESLHLYAAKHRITSDREFTPSQFIGEMEIAPTHALR